MKRIQKLIIATFTVISAVIVWIVTALFAKTSFMCKKSFLLPQGTLLLCGAAGLLLLLALIMRLEALGKRRAPPGRRGRALCVGVECAFWFALFAFQSAVTYCAYFITDWDAGIVLQNAYNIAIYPSPDFVSSYYYAQYPNNVVLTEVFAAILRVFGTLCREPGIDRCALILCLVQCALNTCTGVLTRQVARRITGSTAFSLAVTAVYVGFVGISPWSMIPYSDGMALVFPMTVAYLYLVKEESGHKLPYWLAIGGCSGAAMLIKPQACILSIALFMIEALRWICSRRLKPLAGLCAALAAMALVLGPVNQMIADRSLIELDPEKEFGMTHYVMLGLNSRTDGTYADEDVTLSALTPTRQERTQAQLETVKRRLETLGPVGLLRHLARKTLVNYADGTFAWGINGFFFKTMIEEKDGVFSPFLRDVLYTSGSRYPCFSTYLQAVWLALLAGCLLTGLRLPGENGERRRMPAILCLSVIGLALFEWIFEAKARYLYVFAPVYVLLGVNGYWRLLVRLRQTAEARRKR